MANVLALTLVALTVIAAGESVGMVGAQSLPPNSPSSCNAALVTLAPCLPFLQGGPNTNSSPMQGCCTALASVVNTNATCLCQMVTTTNNPLGIPINQTQALALPGACKITTPPVSQCNSSAVSSPPTAAAPSPTPVVSNPTPKAKSPAPATSAALPPTTTTTTGGAHPPSTKKGPTASANTGSMTGSSMLIQLVAIIGSLAFIISTSST